jgi:hypothetical protein
MFNFAFFFIQLSNKGFDGNGESVNHDVVVVATNELSHSCLVGSKEEIKNDMIPWSPLYFCCILK